MLLLFVVLLVTHQVASQSQCPQVAVSSCSTSFRDDLDISSFAVSANQPEGFKDDGNASDVDDDQCKLITTPSVYIYI